MEVELLAPYYYGEIENPLTTVSFADTGQHRLALF